MKRLQSRYVLAPPARRPLKIFASDPMSGRTAGNRISIEIGNEPLRAGPQGQRVEVIDYDATHDRFYPAVNLDDPGILMQGGLDPSESDPRFHQQMIYAVAMKTVENFDRALGRRLALRRDKYRRLRILPHAFHAANAFYDRELHAILFGYFSADRDNPGANFPGQTVFTCLSHDIIAHEMTHALVDRMRRYFMEPTNMDVLAFHEGFADIVALLQHFSFRELLHNQIQATRGDIRARGALVELARQFGYATGAGKALRSALDEKADPTLYRSVAEPHARGSILVAAVFDAFFNTYQRRIQDLIRIATGGTGRLPEGDLHPDLVNRIAGEASRTAQQILTMCIRAFDYLPPVDITYGDYLRALVTADYELEPADDYGLRSALIDGFRGRGIYPEKVVSPAEESLLWESADPNAVPDLPVRTMETLNDLLFVASTSSRTADTWSEAEIQARESERDTSYSQSAEGTDRDISNTMAMQLHNYAKTYAQALHLDPGLPIEVHGFHPVFRIAPDGRLLIELVAQFAQQDDQQNDDLGGLPLRGGTTLVASVDGKVRYLIAKPLPSPAPSPMLPQELQQEAKARYERQIDYTRLCDSVDPSCAYSSSEQFRQRMLTRMKLVHLHQGALA
ncbi:MAG TPA: hypothetical protein VLA19_31825 [Herpetosiphonaceae bacterium]|nr:hypothetical protein [Herpetosiphonaceae bacterium]